jgi:signal transduction histidine kinase
MAKILVVDDNEINRLLIVKLLGRYKHQLLEAVDGAEALALVKTAAPDLVFTDLLMPRMDGYELIRQVRANPQTANIPIIVYTSLYMARGAAELAKAYAVTDVLTKPSKPEVIIKAVTEALGLPFQRIDPRELANLRLGMFLEIIQQLGQERDPPRLLRNFCERARKIIGTQSAFIAIPEQAKQGFQYFLTSGIEVEQARTELLPVLQKLLNRVLSERLTVSLRSAEINAGSTAAQSERLQSVLVAPLSTAQQFYGWVCLVDKLGADGFGQEEEQVLDTLASQLAITYENILLNTALRQKTEQRNREHMAQLESAQREREAFSLFVAQDIRVPLRTISAHARTLLEKQPANPQPDQQHLIKQIHDSACQTERLITDMLVFSQIGRKELEKTPLDLAALAQSIVGELQQLEPARKFSITIQPLPPVNGDLSMIKQALSCLLSNAFKFTRPRANPAIEIGCRQADVTYVYYVKDNGVGFDNRQANKVFDIFFRLHRPEDFEGKGIGLAIVRRAIERHGGHVWAESQPEAGATFYFALP